MFVILDRSVSYQRLKNVNKLYIVETLKVIQVVNKCTSKLD